MEGVVRHRLRHYLAGRISLTAFRAWFVLATRDAKDQATPRVQRLISSINLQVAEHASYHWTEDELRALLVQILTHGGLVVQDPSP